MAEGDYQGIEKSEEVAAEKVIPYRWSDAMLQKHPPASPASPASPAPTVQAKWFKGGAEGLVQITDNAKHPPQHPDRLARTLNSGGDGHGPDENTLKLAISKTLAMPACTISAGSHTGGPEPINNRIRAGYVRRLTPQECLRLQSGPDDFAWPSKISKANQYKIIGNGWASRMGLFFSRAFAAVDPESRTVIDLFCGGGLGACGWHGRCWKYVPASAIGGAA